jgi:antagonist of KipI
LPGSHAGAFDASAQHSLTRATFHIGAASNRVGLRLEGPALRLAPPLELASAPVARGTLQVPPDGQPIVLMAEHPTTGGYPRMGQVAAIDLPRLAQRRPGDALRFLAIGIEEAQTRYLVREQALHRLSLHLHQRLRER